VQNQAWGMAFIAALVLLQGACLRGVTTGGEWPDVALAGALLIALRFGSAAGLTAGLTAGLLMGWTSGLALPAFLVSRSLPPLATGWMRDHLHGDNFVAQLAAVVCGLFGAEVLFALCCSEVVDAPHWLSRVVTRAVLTAAVTPALAWLVARLPLPEERLAP